MFTFIGSFIFFCPSKLEAAVVPAVVVYVFAMYILIPNRSFVSLGEIVE